MTATQTQIRRDTDDNLMAATPALAELGYNQTTKRLHLGDGSTAGGTITPNAADLQLSSFSFAVAGGTANALTATVTPAPSSLIQPLRVQIKATATNTGAATIDLNSLGVRDIYKVNSSGPVALEGGEIVSGGIYDLTYDGTRFLLSAIGGDESLSGWVLLGASLGVTGIWNVDFTGITSDYDDFVVVFNSVRTVTATPLAWQYQVAGTTWVASGQIYGRMTVEVSGGTQTITQDVTGLQSYGQLTTANIPNTPTDGGTSGTIYFNSMTNGVKQKQWRLDASYSNYIGNNFAYNKFSNQGGANGTSVATGIRIRTVSGNFASGDFLLFGIRRS